MAEIHPTAVIDRGAQIADDAVIGPMCYVGPRSVVGSGTRLMSHVVIHGDTTLGTGNTVWPHTVLGGDPQDLGFKGEPTTLVIGNDNVIRENVTMHRGTPKGGGTTTVGSNNYIMVGVHIAHDCTIGSKILMANNILLAGHIKVEDHVVMAGGCGVHHFTTIGEYAFVGGLAGVVHDVPPYMIADGHPARIRSINRVGLTRGGFTQEQIDTLELAHRKLYRNTREEDSASITKRLDKLEAELGEAQHVANLVAFVRRSISGPHGRYMESFR